MKQYISFLLILSLLTISNFTAFSQTDYSVGDVNGDHGITLQDAMTVLKYSVGLGVLSREALEAADTTGHGKHNAQDALCIIKKCRNPRYSFPVFLNQSP